MGKVIEHENEGQCDQCGKWLGCGTNLERHMKREHEITSEEGSKEEENKRDSSEDKEKGEGKDDRVNGDDEEDDEDENGVKRDLQNDLVGIMVRNLSNQPDRSADYSSHDDNSRIELADYSPYDDKSRIESAEELEEINTIEKQKVKEFELLEVSDKDAELVHEEGYDETINSNKNIVAENNELIVEILLQEKTLTDNNIESERTNLECDKKTIVEQDRTEDSN